LGAYFEKRSRENVYHVESGKIGYETMKYSWLANLLIALLPLAGFAEEPTTARVVTHQGDVSKCLAPIAIRVIDGRLRQLPGTGFKIEPGIHRLAGNATASLHHCPQAQRRSRKPLMGYPAVEWLFEPGKVYYVALNHNSLHEEEWHLVVWKVKTEKGELVFDITKRESPQAQ